MQSDNDAAFRSEFISLLTKDEVYKHIQAILSLSFTSSRRISCLFVFQDILVTDLRGVVDQATQVRKAAQDQNSAIEAVFEELMVPDYQSLLSLGAPP